MIQVRYRYDNWYRHNSDSVRFIEVSNVSRFDQNDERDKIFLACLQAHLIKLRKLQLI